MSATTGYGRGFGRYSTRSEPRVATQPVAVKVDGECRRTYGYVRDFSRSGMQLRTFGLCSDGPRKVGESMQIEFALPECELTVVSCRAQVVWSMAPEHGPQTMNLQGVRFVEIEAGLQDRISECVAQRLAGR